MATTSGLRGPTSNVITKEQVAGTERRWRRFGEPVPAGASVREDGSPDYGLFGPDSIVWKVMLHPATIVFQYPAQSAIQSSYRPILAGVRDHDPISRAARKGELNHFGMFERTQRNSGMHAPMWLGDTETAERMAKHLRNIHQKVAGEVIDVGDPELGGYAAAGPREAMWAALTEMHSMLWAYEGLAFRDGRPPHRLPPHERDQFMAEAAAYCRLVGADEEEIPTSIAELDALYVKYGHLFGPTATMAVIPETGENINLLYFENLRKNYHKSQRAVARYNGPINHTLFRMWVGAVGSEQLRAWMGMTPEQSRRAVRRTKLSMPLIWLFQRGPVERHFMRLMWGPDGVTLIRSAREQVKKAKAAARAQARAAR
ncbi:MULTISPECIES: oxygenase MpaB family protein [Streptacidiphilus]|uniref:Oxygenase MpaB family protein n=1 Tax=Streptacidiphilus cavernicola TaxID=3342716 RepID=A0ABV6UPK6_9ACTN|nr:oxygenase MpaB family protein [Streptacidiphilus jeojiense]